MPGRSAILCRRSRFRWRQTIQDVPLDLQAAFTTAYDQAGYDYSLDYTAGVQPVLSTDDTSWLTSRLAP